MRLTRTRFAVPLILLVLAGCGGDQVVVNNVPGGPVDLQVPGDGAGLTGNATATPTATPSETPGADDASATATPEAGATAEAPATGGTEPAPTDTGGAAEAPQTDNGGGGTGEAPEAGAPKEEFEDYCAQNPGAC